MKYILNAAPLLAALFGIYLTSIYGYLLFHSLVEGFSIVIACGIFMIAWNARRLLQNHYLLFIGIAYLFVGGIDFLHILAYKGMGVFEGYGANLPTQLWIAGRYMEALSLLSAAIFFNRRLSPGPAFVAYGLSTGLLLSSIFYWKVFPDCFIEGVGLTSFKIHSEYIICLILLAAIGLLVKNSKVFDRKVLILLVASIATTIIQELAFTTYLSVYGPSNMIGHLLKIVSFYLVYKAIIETSLVSPWKLLFRDLKQSEAKFRSIFETNVVPIAYCHVDGRVLDANDDYLKLIGFSRQELRGGEVRWDVVTPPEWKHIDETGLEYLRQDGVSPPLEKEYLRRDGTRVPILFGACLVPGDPEQVIVFAVDLTERKSIEGELRRARDELELRVQERTAELKVSNKALMEYAAKLERLNEELQDFAFVASHDLQEPLRKILTFCDMAMKRCAPALDSTGQEYLNRISNSAGRMRQLLRDLLQLSKAASKQEPFKEINLGKTVREAADLFEEDLRQSGGLVEIDAMPYIEAEEGHMLRLFKNLIGNALKFRRDESPRIKIHAKYDGQGWCEILVKDNGIGFDPQFAERIFKPFQKLHGRKEYEGTGMGLAICKKIVERHGGSIRAESEPAKGSSFIIRLPVKQQALKP